MSAIFNQVRQENFYMEILDEDEFSPEEAEESELLALATVSEDQEAFNATAF